VAPNTAQIIDSAARVVYAMRVSGERSHTKVLPAVNGACGANGVKLFDSCSK
jgi:hypothetical protein